jgi:hypothetical protein
MAAIHISLASKCARLRVGPWAYLQEVLSRLPSTPANQLATLLPDRWQAARSARVAGTAGSGPSGPGESPSATPS